MKRYLKPAAILAFAVLGVVSAGLPLFSDDGSHSGAVTPAADMKRERNSVDEKTAGEIRSRLTSIINETVTTNGFNNMVGSLEKTQRDRINDEHFKELDLLNGSIDKFRKAFKEKYNEEFSFKDELLNDAAINQGADNTHATADVTPVFKSLIEPKSLPAHGNDIAADQARDAMRPLKDLEMVKEDKLIGNAWRLRIAGSPTARQLADSLNSKIFELANSSDKWPADAKTTYLKVAKQVLKTVNEPVEATDQKTSAQ